MRLQDIMNSAVETVAPELPAEEAWDLMRLRGFHHLVVKKNGRVVGILSDRDLGGESGRRRRADKAVGDLMNVKVVTAKPESTINEAANALRGHNIGCLPIVKRNKLVGIVTVTDLLELLGRGTQRPRRDLTRRSPKKIPGVRRR